MLYVIVRLALHTTEWECERERDRDAAGKALYSFKFPPLSVCVTVVCTAWELVYTPMHLGLCYCRVRCGSVNSWWCTRLAIHHAIQSVIVCASAISIRGLLIFIEGDAQVASQRKVKRGNDNYYYRTSESVCWRCDADGAERETERVDGWSS